MKSVYILFELEEMSNGLPLAAFSTKEVADEMAERCYQAMDTMPEESDRRGVFEKEMQEWKASHPLKDLVVSEDIPIHPAGFSVSELNLVAAADQAIANKSS